MEKIPMCRICLVENVRMYVVNDKDLQELYETLTDIPFVTEDRRPLLACFICCTKLKQCCQLQRKCLEAEELLTQMVKEDYELNPPINHFRGFNALVQSPIVNVSIGSDGKCNAIKIECDDVKEVLPAVCERLDDVLEIKEELQCDDLELENLYNSPSDAEDVPAHQSESVLEDYVPLIEIKTEVEEEQEVLRKNRRDSDTTRAAVAKKQKLHIRGKKLEREESDTKATPQNTSTCTFKLSPKFEKPLPQVIRVIDNTLDANCHRNIKNRNFKKQTRIRSGGGPYKCDICQHSCKQKGNLISHIRVHTGEKPFKCDICQCCFSEKSTLTSHIRTHTGEKPYRCKECQRCFSQKGSLKTHIRTHSGEKPYRCEECRCCYKMKSSLINHIRTHTNEKPYKCEECQRRFSMKSILISHIRTHTGEKPFWCEKCGLCFSRMNTLTRHILTHTGEKPHKCDICERCFSRKNNLSKHIRRHTSD